MGGGMNQKKTHSMQLTRLNKLWEEVKSGYTYTYQESTVHIYYQESINYHGSIVKFIKIPIGLGDQFPLGDTQTKGWKKFICFFGTMPPRQVELVDGCGLGFFNLCISKFLSPHVSMKNPYIQTIQSSKLRDICGFIK